MTKASLEIAEDKSVKISWGAIVFLLSVMFGFAAWMTSQELSAQSNKEEISKIHSQYDLVQEKLESMDNKLTRVEIGIEYMRKQRGK